MIRCQVKVLSLRRRPSVKKFDAAHLADELCNEQDMTQSLEREKKLIEAQAKDMQVRREERRP